MLFQLEESRKALVIIERDDVQKKIRKAFGLDDNVKTVFQAYKDEWSEWCDIEEAEIQHNWGTEGVGELRVFVCSSPQWKYTYFTTIQM